MTFNCNIPTYGIGGDWMDFIVAQKLFTMFHKQLTVAIRWNGQRWWQSGGDIFKERLTFFCGSSSTMTVDSLGGALSSSSCDVLPSSTSSFAAGASGLFDRFLNKLFNCTTYLRFPSLLFTSVWLSVSLLHATPRTHAYTKHSCVGIVGYCCFVQIPH